MSVPELLARIRPTWLHRIAHDMARGAGVRENFTLQLERFFDLMVQCVESGDYSWIDPVLIDWANVPTESDLEDSQAGITTILNKIVTLTNEVARETLSSDDALDLITAVTPLFTYGIERVARIESENRVTYVTNQLGEMRQKLERLDRSKSNFIAVAAHELKTPLTLIEGYSSMIRDLVKPTDPAAASLESLLHGVSQGINRLREIVDDMIDVSLIDNNLLSLNFQPIWINHIFHLLNRDVTKILKERKQTLKIRDFPGSGQTIFADPERLFQAFRNVLNNAIKYTPDGGTITVNGRKLPGFIEVTITDTGIGISPEDQPMIFEKFGGLGQVALHSSGKTKFKGGGPGLGLPISRGIIEAHGGTIWVESEGHDEEKCPGSTFHILLPERKDASDLKIAKLFGTEPLPQEENGPETPRTNNPPA
jgi:signal transduction histidine kinase